MLNKLAKLFQCSILTITLALFIASVGIASEDTIDEEDEECCDSIPADLEDQLVEGIELILKIFPESLFDEEEKIALIKEAKQELNENLKNPDAAFEQKLTKLETVVPELSGISTTWQTMEETTLFSELTIAIARHHEANDKQISRLKATTQRLIDTAPGTMLPAAMGIYTKSLVSNVQKIKDDLSDYEQWSTEILEMKEQFVDWYPEADVSFTDDFFTCVNSLKTKANKKMTNMFGRLANKMDRAARSIEKMQQTDQDFQLETSDAITNVFTPYIVDLSTLRQQVLSDDCYDKIDFERFKQIAADLEQDS